MSRQAEETYAKLMKEAKERDHRLIGKKLELFMFDENSPGNVFFLNRGLLIYNRLVEHMRTQYLREYEEIASPLMFRSDLWRVTTTSRTCSTWRPAGLRSCSSSP